MNLTQVCKIGRIFPLVNIAHLWTPSKLFLHSLHELRNFFAFPFGNCFTHKEYGWIIRRPNQRSYMKEWKIRSISYNVYKSMSWKKKLHSNIVMNLKIILPRFFNSIQYLHFIEIESYSVKFFFTILEIIKHFNGLYFLHSHFISNWKKFRYKEVNFYLLFLSYNLVKKIKLLWRKKNVLSRTKIFLKHFFKAIYPLIELNFLCVCVWRKKNFFFPKWENLREYFYDSSPRFWCIGFENFILLFTAEFLQFIYFLFPTFEKRKSLGGEKKID